jgi:hypothetical protein
VTDGKFRSPPDTEKFPRFTERILVHLRLRLRENFDRFNSKMYKEKEMVSFRRVILALAILALFTGLASAQVNSGGSGGGNLTCSVLNTSNPTQVRAEGYSELLGDIVIQCVGGAAVAAGGAVSLANITVALNSTIVTSKSLSNGFSEALLLIDEPGAGASVGLGGTLPQTVCSSPAGIGAGPTGTCTVVAGFNGPYYGAVATGTTTVVNVFPGVVLNNNQVTFNGIPILAPVTAGQARLFRITNIRANAAQLSSGPANGTTPVLASVSISSGIQLTNPLQTVGYLYQGLGATSVRSATNGGTGNSMLNLLQCGTTGLTSGAVLRFTEGFAAAFKTRVAQTGSYSGALTNGSGPVSASNVTQNSPAQILPGSESGFVLPVSPAGGTAGLADFGTRLKATFNNVPTGINIFVSTTNINPLGNINVTVPAQTNVAPFNSLQNLAPGGVNSYAALVLSETATAGAGGFLPLMGGTNNQSGTNVFGPLPVDANGTATAVWEILSQNPNATETYDFSVFYSYTGNPASNIPPTSPTGSVSFSFAPTYTSPTASGLVPRFVGSTTSTPLVSAALCQTTLLYPWVNAEPGFDTGIAIANTTSDPWGTRTQNGTCTLNFFGTGAGTTTTATTPTINTGTVYADQVSNLKPNFRGYVIAVCNFQLAHGYALFSDTGIRNWATGYLALVIPTGTGNRNSGQLVYSPVTPVEGLGN